jgi:GntR family transcriptional repressor for pyruvate dehydrogenase complex
MSDQVADQLRELIVTGVLAPDSRLPREEDLTRSLGVSRATVREALRTLAGQSLIRTARGPTGGTFVSVPSVDHVADFMRSSLTLLSESRTVSLDQLIEARELIEIPAARLAASRRADADLERLDNAIPGELTAMGTGEQFAHNRDFHCVVLDLCANPLLSIAAQPLFSVLQTRLVREALGERFHRSINEHHRRISAAIAVGDPDAAGEEMRAHLEFLRPAYERAWHNSNHSRREPGTV